MKTIGLVLFCLLGLCPQRSQAQEALPRTESELGLKESLNLTGYNEIYYAYGNPSAKVQFSFKYQMIEKLPLYIGYTQLMFWLQQQDSQPFNDVNYSPDAFYRIQAKVGILESVDLAPYSHTSNGRDGADSRSINRAYARLNLETPSANQEIKMVVTLYSYYGLNEDNSDIHDFISPLDLRFIFTQFVPWIFDRGQLSVRVFPGGRLAENWGSGGQEVGLSFRVGGFGLKPSIYIQYYGGYAESLLSYRRRESIARIGIVL